MNCNHSIAVREWLQELPSGMLFFLGCHLIDLIYSIQGEPKEIIPLSSSTNLDGVTANDLGMVVMKYENGVSLAKANDTQLGGFARRSLVVTGSKKTVAICPLEIFKEIDLMSSTKTVYESGTWGDRGETTESTLFDRYDSMMASFASFVRGDQENSYTYDYELQLYKTILKCCGLK